MELIELKKALIEVLINHYDEDVEVLDGDVKRIPNRAGKLIGYLENEDNPDVDVLEDVEAWMEKNEPYLTHLELSLKSEVNRHICILLTKEEL